MSPFTPEIFHSREKWHYWNLQLLKEPLRRGWIEARSFICSFCGSQSGHFLTQTHFLLIPWASAAVFFPLHGNTGLGVLQGVCRQQSWPHSVLIPTQECRYDTICGSKLKIPQPGFVSAPHLVSSMLLQLLVELQGDANHHFSFIPVGVGDVVQDAIEICGRDEHLMNKHQPMIHSVTVTLSINENVSY